MARMTKTQKGLAVAGLVLGGGLIYLLATRGKAEEAPPQIEPPGTAEEPAPEIPLEEPAEPAQTKKPVKEGFDRFPRYSVAIVSTSTGPETFEKEFDLDKQQIRWINFANPKYGSYLNIDRLASNHWPIRISVGGAALWENNMFTPYGVRYFGLASPATPLRALL